ncbi:MAG: glycosyltransferase [Flavobacteriales bacterium]|nr:glycosyltransferase [Flavobacteriales bacterium]MCL4856152.1 glycosyltransferase [Flavobacteriales bacterium]
MTDKKLNILFLASWYPNNLLPKNGNFIQQHAFAVAQHCNVAALHIIANNQTEDFILEEQTVNGVLEVFVYYRKINSNIPILSHLKKLNVRHQAHLLGYNRIVEKLGKIDITHLNVVFPAGNFALYLKRKYNIPYIITEHWTALQKSFVAALPFLIKKMAAKTFNEAATICPVSDDLMNAIKVISSNPNYEVVPNVVDTSVFNYREKALEKKILHVSNLKNEHKNITGIIDTIKELSKIRDDFFISIIGDGDYEYFIRYAENIQIPKHLYNIEGAKSYEEIAELMRTHDLFLLYSNYENLPCVIAEALVCGLPVLTSNVGGTAEMVDTTNGVVIPAADNKTLLKELNQLLDNLGGYNHTKIANDAANKYSYNSVGKQFLEIYKKILNI